MIIYCIENLINGKRYVGQYSKVNSDEEFQQSNYWGSGIAIKNAIKKYGFENFRKWVLIKNIETKEKLDNYERLWIKKLNTIYKNGYNLTYGGEGVNGLKHTDRSKQKMSNSKKEFFKNGGISYNKGRKASNKTKEKLKYSHMGQKAWNKGERLSDETKEKLSYSLKKYYETHDSPMKNKKTSDETKEKLSYSLKKYYENGGKPWNEGKQKSKECVEKQKNSLKKYYETHDSPMKNKKTSEEVRKRQSDSRKKYFENGGTVWNKGKFGLNKGVKSKRIEKRCCECGKEYSGVVQSKYCSSKCRNDHYFNSLPKIQKEKKPMKPKEQNKKHVCLNCGKAFLSKSVKSKYCSRKCGKRHWLKNKNFS